MMQQLCCFFNNSEIGRKVVDFTHADKDNDSSHQLTKSDRSTTDPWLYFDRQLSVSAVLSEAS